MTKTEKAVRNEFEIACRFLCDRCRIPDRVRGEWKPPVFEDDRWVHYWSVPRFNVASACGASDYRLDFARRHPEVR